MSKWIKDANGNLLNVDHIYSIDLILGKGLCPYVKAYHSCNDDSVVLFEPKKEMPNDDKLEFCEGYMKNLELNYLNEDLKE